VNEAIIGRFTVTTTGPPVWTAPAAFTVISLNDVVTEGDTLMVCGVPSANTGMAPGSMVAEIAFAAVAVSVAVCPGLMVPTPVKLAVGNSTTTTVAEDETAAPAMLVTVSV
jgi:hypothetical protein